MSGVSGVSVQVSGGSGQLQFVCFFTFSSTHVLYIFLEVKVHLRVCWGWEEGGRPLRGDIRL